jgi:3',5'-cyclic AMP phosphodiesterase CpdA
VQLIHLTDPHLTGLDGWTPGLTAGKRWLSWLSWQRKRRHVHLRNRLDALVAALGTPEPEAWAITGDLCQIGLDREIDEARDWLAGLAPAERVLLVPGNHDIFAAGSEARLRRDWKDWLHLDGQDCDWPVERVFGDVVLIGVNSSIVTPPTRATGGLGEAQQQRLRETLRRHAGRCRVVLIHHPPLPGSCKPRKALLDAAVLTELLQAEGPALVLHGHLHHNRRRDLPGGSGGRVYCTASASAGGALGPACARRFTIQRQGDGQYSIKMELLGLDASNRVHVLEQEQWLSAG